MAKLRVSTDLILRLLFPDQYDLSIEGVEQIDPSIIVFDIRGMNVPGVAEVKAILHMQRQTTTFVPIDEPIDYLAAASK